MFIIVTLYGSVCSLIFINTAWWYQNGCHHGQIAICRSYHIRHYISVVVFTSPDKAAFWTNYAGNRIINKRVEILNAKFLKFFFIFRIINFLENVLKCMVVFFGNGIFSREPQVLFSVHCITKACACKTGNGFFCIVNSLNDSRTIKVVNYFFGLCSILSGKYKFCCSFTRNFDFCIFINITIRMTCNRNRLCPIFYIRNDSLNKDWCTKYRTI